MQPQPRHHRRDHRGVQRLQPLDGRHRELGQPATHGARRRQDLQPAEALKQRVIRDILHVLYAPAPDDQQPDQQAHHRHDAKVASHTSASERRTDHGVQPHPPQIALEQFQPRIRRELDIVELKREIAIDTRMQIGVSSSHCQWPFVCGRGRLVALPFNHNERPFSITNVLGLLRNLSDQG